jgi:hypothetical protein
VSSLLARVSQSQALALPLGGLQTQQEAFILQRLRTHSQGKGVHSWCPLSLPLGIGGFHCPLECGLPTDQYESVQDFLQKMDAGEFDNKLMEELRKLSKDQLEQLGKILIERDPNRSPLTKA